MPRTNHNKNNITIRNMRRFEISITLSILLAGLLLIFFAVPVSASKVISHDEGTVGSSTPSTTTVYKTPAIDLMFRSWSVTGVGIETPAYLQGLTTIYTTTSALAVPASGSVPVDLTYGSTTKGSGTFIWSRDTGTSTTTMLLSIEDDIDISGLPASAFLNFTTSGTTWAVSSPVSIAASGNNQGYSEFISDLNGYFANGAAGYITPAQHTYQYSTNFQNAFTIDRYDNFLNKINVTKDMGDTTYPSRIRIFTTSNRVIFDEGSVTAFDNFSYYTMTVPLGISAQSNLGFFYNSSLYFTAAYNMVLSSPQIQPNETVVSTVSSPDDITLANINFIEWQYSDELGSFDLYDGGNSSRYMAYSKIGGTWYGLDKTTNQFTVSKGASIPNPVTIGWIPTTGNKTITCFIFTTDNNYYKKEAPLIIGAPDSMGKVITHVLPVDQYGNVVIGASVGVYNKLSRLWSNFTFVSGESDFKVYSSPEALLDIYASKTGYTSTPKLNVKASPIGDESTYKITLFPTAPGTLPASGYTVLYIDVQAVCSQQYQNECLTPEIQGAQVTIRDVNNTFIQSGTSGSGTTHIIQMNVPNNTAYTWSATAKDYTSTSGSFTIVAEPIYSITILMDKIFVTPTKTLAPGQTARPTAVTPTPTLRAGQSPEEYRVERGFDILSQNIEGWFYLGTTIVSFWLIWAFVYYVSGGDFLRKMNKGGGMRGKRWW